jgi:hypothetical protein
MKQSWLFPNEQSMQIFFFPLDLDNWEEADARGRMRLADWPENMISAMGDGLTLGRSLVNWARF